MQWRMLAAAGLCAVVTPISVAEDASNGELIEALRAEVAELRSTVDRMKAEQSDDCWRTLTRGRA